MDKRLRFEDRRDRGDQKYNWGQSLICNQQDLVVYSEFYRKPVEGCENRGDVGPTAGSS